MTLELVKDVLDTAYVGVCWALVLAVVAAAYRFGGFYPAWTAAMIVFISNHLGWRRGMAEARRRGPARP